MIKDPHGWSWLMVFVALGLGLVLASMSCSGGDDDDNDNDSNSYGQVVGGLFAVIITTDVNTCPDSGDMPDNEEWFFDINQSEDLSTASVYRQKAGSSTDKSLFFKGTVYGTSIIEFQAQETTFPDSDCVQIHLKDYRLDVNPEAAEVYGSLYDDIFYLGEGCTPSTVDCRTEQIVKPQAADDDDTSTTDDDTSTADDDTSSDDDSSS